MNVGEFVRTNLRNEIVIRKVIDIIHSTSMNDNRMVFDKPTKFTYYVEDNENYKSSPQIIDLIEVGDYVNGYKVIGIVRGFKILVDKLELDTTTGLYHHKSIMAKNIKTIVTHEQMEAMQYRVEE